jgi:hypothetical protein
VRATVSAVDDLVLHAPRVLGFAPTDRIAAHYGLDPGDVEDHLLDYGARGWVGTAAFDGTSGWFVTAEGRAEDERRMAAELDRTGARDVATAAYADFLPLNARFGRVCTDWQVRPSRVDALAANDHTDRRWDERVLRALGTLGRELTAVTATLAGRLQRFDGYAARYTSALARVDGGQWQYVAGPGIESCHTVWMQLHEDLLATLGIPRGAED